MTTLPPHPAAPPPALGEVSRRRLLGGGLALLGLTACGQSDLAASGADDDVETRTVTDSLGRDVEVPASPQRVVLLSDREIAASLVTLGYAPLAVAATDDSFRERLASLGGTPVDLADVQRVGSSDEINLEAVAALRPDLIVGFGEDLLTELSDLAPTVVVDMREVPDHLAPQRLLARLVGLEAELDARVAEYDARLEEVRTSFPGVFEDLEYTIVDQYSPAAGNYVYDLAGEHSWWPAVIVLEDLGATVGRATLDAAVGQEYGTLEVSIERLPEYDADVVFMATLDDQPIDPDVLAVMQATSAAGHGQLFQVNSETWSFAHLQGRLAVLDDIERLLGGREIVTAGDFA